MSKSILIVDDHILFSRSLKILVNSLEDYEVVETLKNGQELVDYFKAGNPAPDIVLLDIRMPVMNGMEAMAWLKENKPEQKTLALTMEHEEEVMLRMLKLGCRGYLLKDIDPEDFHFAMEEVLSTGYHLDEGTARKLSEKNKEHLTSREFQFMELVCTEKTYKEIAEDMHLSPKTIDGYREQLFAKLQVKSRTGMVLYALRHNLVTI